jgi:hypothetical protein
VIKVLASTRRTWLASSVLVLVLGAGLGLPAQQWVTETRDPKQTQDEDFAKAYRDWTSEPRYGSPLVDHLPRVPGIPTPKDVLGYHVGAPRTLTYYDSILKYYRALAAATPRVRIETIGKSDENRELVVVWVSSDANMKNLQQNRDNLARIADPRGLNDGQVRQLIQTTKPHYHLMGGLHSGEFGPPEMLMELVYRLATETSPYISQIRDNVYVSITPVADADGRDRNVDWFYRGLEMQQLAGAGGPGGGPGGGGGGGGVPYWGKYVYHDNNRDINLSQMQMRALVQWYYTAHPPIMHDLHESLSLLYTYSGGPPQNPNLDPLLFAELSFFANWELSQMTKWGMPGVYTHAFMDGWSPGYLGSVAYNHNGMMKMYETQSGRDLPTAAGSGVPGAGVPGAGSGSDTGAAGAARGAGGAGAPPAGAARGGGAGAGQGRGGGGRGAGGDAVAGAGAPQAPPAGRAGAPTGGGRGGGVPTGRGGGQDREWYRGIQVPQNAVNNFTRRNNANYMQTGVLSALQLTAMFPNLVLENFYTRTKNSMEAGLNAPPHAYVIPVQRDMTKPAEMVRILKIQGIEVGTANAEFKIGDRSYAAGSYVIKAGQPYWRLVKNLLEKQDYPDPALRTYDDSGWTMGLAFGVDVQEIRDKSVLNVPTTLVKEVAARGALNQNLTCDGVTQLAVLHQGSNNMISFRYRLKDVPMKVTQKAFSSSNRDVPAGSFIIARTGSRPAGPQSLGAEYADINKVAHELGLNTALICGQPAVATHDADVPRIAIYSNWSGTQELGWYRHAFDQFGIPFTLIYKERIAKGNLKNDFDVILMAAQGINRTSVMAQPAARPQPYLKSDKYKFLGMYGETPDMSGGFGQAGVDAVEDFLEAGGTLITTLGAVRFPIEFGWARSFDTEGVTGLNAQKPLVQAEIVKTDHPAFYGYADKIIPVKYGQGQQVFRYGVSDQDKVIGRFVGGQDSVLSGLGEGADALRQRAFAVDIPEASRGKGRVIMFSGNPIYRWQNHGEFNMVFNSIINWNDTGTR